jgi:hypothetical protein
MSELTLKERLGIGLEKWIYAMLKSLYPESEDYIIKHPDWTNYNNHNGVDFRVFKRCKEILAIECKNWRKLDKKYGSDIAQTEIVERFQHIGTNLKLCIISFMDVLSKPSVQLIKSHGIQLFEVGKLVGYKDFKFSLFYTIKSALAKTMRSVFGCCSSCSSTSSVGLDNYVSIPSTHNNKQPNNKQTIPTLENNNDNSKDKPRFDYKPRFEDRTKRFS